MNILDLSISDFTAILISYDYDSYYNPLVDKIGLLEELSIYDFIENKSNNFNIDRLKIIKEEMESAYNIITSLNNIDAHSHDTTYKYTLALIYDKLKPHKQIIIPEALNAGEAKNVFSKAIEAGLMYQTKTGYHWNNTKALLAYFIDVFSDKLNDDKYNLRMSNGRIRWAIFKPLFGIDKDDNSLNDAVNEYRNRTGQKPEGYKIIDNLF